MPGGPSGEGRSETTGKSGSIEVRSVAIESSSHSGGDPEQPADGRFEDPTGLDDLPFRITAADTNNEFFLPKSSLGALVPYLLTMLTGLVGIESYLLLSGLAQQSTSQFTGVVSWFFLLAIFLGARIGCMKLLERQSMAIHVASLAGLVFVSALVLAPFLAFVDNEISRRNNGNSAYAAIAAALVIALALTVFALLTAWDLSFLMPISIWGGRIVLVAWLLWFVEPAILQELLAFPGMVLALIVLFGIFIVTETTNSLQRYSGRPASISADLFSSFVRRLIVLVIFVPFFIAFY